MSLVFFDTEGEDVKGDVPHWEGVADKDAWDKNDDVREADDGAGDVAKDNGDEDVEYVHGQPPVPKDQTCSSQGFWEWLAGVCWDRYWAKLGKM